MAGKVFDTWLTIFVSLILAGATAEAKSIRKIAKARTDVTRVSTEPSGEELRPPFPRWEVRTAPIAILASWYTLDLSYRLTEHIATGPAGIAFQCEGPGGMLSPCWKGSALGWQGTYYIHPVVNDGPYVSSHVYYDSFDSYPHGASHQYEEVEGIRAHAFLGYKYQFPLNVLWHLGAGWEMRSYDRITIDETTHEQIDEKSGGYTQSGIMLEAKVGFQF